MYSTHILILIKYHKSQFIAIVNSYTKSCDIDYLNTSSHWFYNLEIVLMRNCKEPGYSEFRSSDVFEFNQPSTVQSHYPKFVQEQYWFAYPQSTCYSGDLNKICTNINSSLNIVSSGLMYIWFFDSCLFMNFMNVWKILKQVIILNFWYSK